MALVVRRDGYRMSSDGANIHPFFKLDAQKAVTSSALPLVQPALEPPLQPHHGPVTNTTLTNGKEVVNQHDDSIVGHEKDRITKPPEPAIFNVSSTVLRSVCKGDDLEAQPENMVSHISKPVRKRQKVAQPESLSEGKQGTLPWRRPSISTSKDGRTVEGTSVQGLSNNIPVDPNLSVSTNETEQTTGVQAQPSFVQKDAHDIKMELIRPPKKIMKLRTDGKLFSPPKKVTVVGSTKRGRKVDSEQKKRLVVLKYGNTPESRREIGEKIERILKGELRIKPRVEIVQQSQPANVKIELPTRIEPHPFFLGQRKPEGHKEHLLIPSQPSKSVSRGTSPSRSSGKTVEKPSASLLFGTSANKAIFPPDAKEPLWPPKDMLHVRDQSTSIASITNSSSISHANVERKAKELEVRLKTQEEVWHPLKNFVNDPALAQHVHEDSDAFPSPKRRMVVRTELQTIVSKELENGDFHNANPMTEPSTEPYQCASLVAQKLFDTLPAASSAFDSFRCENQEWIVKYAPKSSMEVLQPQESMQLLRDWLSGSTVHSTASHLNTTIAKKKGKPGRKRKQISELDDFIVNSDDDDTAEASEYLVSYEPDMKGFNFDKSAPRHDSNRTRRFNAHTLPQTKAVILSGPHGCGKTAAIHAIAQELGFEIFEINAGSRRSGRDILEKVGDMTKNHLVSQLSGESEHHEEQIDGQTLEANDVNQEIASGKQSTMQSFFKKKQVSKVAKDKPQRTNPIPENKAKQTTELKKISKAQKQSLILLEEVDILFEEDKQFWSTVITLISSSKRPIVMTCNDESLLPTDMLEDCSLLRLSNPPQSMVVEYLLLMAAHEGHLLTQEAISTLYIQTALDFRASIMQLNFWCQMAIRDSMGGLNWILFPQDYQDDDIPITERRIMSEGTFLPYMGILGNNTSRSTIDHDEHTQRIYDAALEWELHTEDLSYQDTKLPEQVDGPVRYSHDELACYDRIYDALSATEVLQNAVFLDEIKADSHSRATEFQQFSNFTINPPVLHTTAEADTLSCDPSIIVGINYYARSAMTGLLGQSSFLFNHDQICNSIIHRKKPMSAHHAFIKKTMCTALDPLTDCCSQPYPTVARDLAPYIRSIVSYDDRLEQERSRLNQLLSDGARSGKRQRTTRASRAALEGGHKASTRRERWFECELDFPLILETGGAYWQDIAWSWLQREARKIKWVQQAEYTESEDELCL